MGGTTRHVLDLAKGRLAFGIATYFQVQRLDLFYPDISIVFTVRDPSQHCHISLRLSPFGYARNGAVERTRWSRSSAYFGAGSLCAAPMLSRPA